MPKLKKRKNPPFGDEAFIFNPGFYYQTTNIAPPPQGTIIVYIDNMGNIYRVDLKTYRFLKMMDSKSEVSKTYYEQKANDSYWELFLEPIKNNKLLRFLDHLKSKQKNLNIQTTLKGMK